MPSSTTVSRYAFFSELASIVNLELLSQAVSADKNSPEWILFNSAYQITLGDALSNLAQTVYGFTNAQMEGIFANAQVFDGNISWVAGDGGSGIYTALDIINMALKDAGVLGVGQSALAEDANDALRRLNWMIGQWNRRRWLIYHLKTYMITSTGASSYTVGPSGDFNIARRPDQIESAFLRQPVTGGLPVDYPLVIWKAREDYDKVAVKTLVSFPSACFYDSAYPLGTIYFWPVAQASIYQMSISVKETLQSFANLTDYVVLPDEYMDALYLNLAMRLRMAYQLVPNPDLNKQAALALQTLRKANTQVPQLVMPAELRKGNVYNIYSDQNK